jgi:hypothetical protein
MFAILRMGKFAAATVMPQRRVGIHVGGSVGMGRVPVQLRAWIVGPLLSAAALTLVGCSGASDFLSRDAEWFNRPSRIFTNNAQIETPPLSEQKPIAPDDLISAEGYCSGMAPPSDANALTENQAAPAGTTVQAAPAGIALGRSECEVARYAGRPDNVELGNDPRGDRTAVLTYLKGPRPGIYRFIAGRLSSVERAPVPEAPARPAKQKKRA